MEPPPPEDEGELLALAGEEVFFELPEPHDAGFVRGDVNDDGGLDISDAISSLVHLFSGGQAPYCADAADADDSGVVDISDPIVVLQFLFRGGASIAAPYPERGFDGTPDELFCSARE